MSTTCTSALTQQHTHTHTHTHTGTLYTNTVNHNHLPYNPGSHLKLPFVCPLDHVVNMDHANWHEFREHTFYNHPEVPDSVRESAMLVEVRICEGEVL